jgi:hypothetical protein
MFCAATVCRPHGDRYRRPESREGLRKCDIANEKSELDKSALLAIINSGTVELVDERSPAVRARRPRTPP